MIFLLFQALLSVDPNAMLRKLRQQDVLHARSFLGGIAPPCVTRRRIERLVVAQPRTVVLAFHGFVVG